MKKYCINCGRVLNGKPPKKKKNKKGEELLENNSTFDTASSNEPIDKENYCYHCHTSNSFDDLAIMDSHEFNQKAHNNIIKASDTRENALCFFVGGIILTIIGILFFVLSFKKNVRGIRVFRPASFEFVLAIVCLVIGVAMLIYGIVRLVIAYRKIKYFRSVLRDVDYKEPEQSTSKEDTPKEKEAK